MAAQQPCAGFFGRIEEGFFEELVLETVLKNVYTLDTGRKSILDPEDDTAKALTQVGFVQTVPTWRQGGAG